MSNKLTIAGDVAWDIIDDFDGELAEDEIDDEGAMHRAIVRTHAEKHGVVAVMVEEHGPGGGHPVYEFTGTRAQLEAFVIDFYDAGQAHSEDVEFYFEDAVEA